MLFFLSGTFVFFTAGILNSFDGMALFIALTDSFLLHYIFQRGDRYYRNFIIDDFSFYLASEDEEQDLFHYNVTSGDFCMMVAVSGIDTTKHCGPLSNHFTSCWRTRV